MLSQGPGRASRDSKMCSPSERVKHVVELRPEICSLDIVTMNRKRHVFLNHPEHLKYMSASIQSAGVKPELEVFDTGPCRTLLVLALRPQIELKRTCILGVPGDLKRHDAFGSLLLYQASKSRGAVQQRV